MVLFTIFIILVVIFESAGQLLWNDPSASDFHCTYPPAIGYPQHIITALNGWSQRYKMYAPMANKTYYRWMYHKAKNTPAMTQADINSLKPRVTFPDVSAFSTISQGTVSIFNPPTAYYKLLCIPSNWALSNSTCLVKNASRGSAPFGFGTGDPVISTIIWADTTAFAEWHCFEGDRQVFNVISLKSYLTRRQVDSIVNLVVKYGFSTSNIELQVYR
ncbi:hypothetical protein Bhyg_15902 [Pseudolycoriella hygida]|uniref:Uncharacterized protein n=1 Tax=Pseudolycoriella hygida TaxID=35572 RepID=A0A9Q0MJY2_9DIPT|nr:hypothetical protein Bhyg_15902 [Pseudolycoriella hygida]